MIFRYELRFVAYVMAESLLAHWTCLYFSLCFWVVILCPALILYRATV